MAVKWLASGMVANRVSTPASPQASTILRLCRRYSALSLPPTTASNVPRAGDFQNKGLTALAVALSSFNGALMDVLTSGRNTLKGLNGRGRVKVGDGSWTVTGPDMVAGARVRVTAVNGTELAVEPAP